MVELELLILEMMVTLVQFFYRLNRSTNSRARASSQVAASAIIAKVSDTIIKINAYQII